MYWNELGYNLEFSNQPSTLFRSEVLMLTKEYDYLHPIYTFFVNLVYLYYHNSLFLLLNLIHDEIH